MCGVSQKERCRNSDVRQRCGLKKDVLTRVERGMVRFGHQERMNENRLIKEIYSAMCAMKSECVRSTFVFQRRQREVSLSLRVASGGAAGARAVGRAHLIVRRLIRQLGLLRGPEREFRIESVLLSARVSRTSADSLESTLRLRSWLSSLRRRQLTHIEKAKELASYQRVDSHRCSWTLTIPEEEQASLLGRNSISGGMAVGGGITLDREYALNVPCSAFSAEFQIRSRVFNLFWWPEVCVCVQKLSLGSEFKYK
ncbi:hypothetical protein EVAR_472_1 [Eumeta japonica]|uniref:Uncharacterized protein n=1 Tax=Eumeta variegata TaxID=151549 RepID=A0A4C1SAM6_EUMVA|nr:hypothetical protein EVAR_472_1 [Eumeta japonica]